MTLKILADRPIDYTILLVIKCVEKAATDLGLEICLVGAMARIILLENVYGLYTGRATRDIDFAFAVEDWEQFYAIKKHLISTYHFMEIKNVAHRLKYEPIEMNIQFVIDLIPFGKIEDENNIITWPPELSILMNVAGFQDAYKAAIDVEIAEDLIFSLASIPGIAILKLFAWADRGKEDPKDAIDLLTLLRQYNAAGNQDRIYQESIAVLESLEYDIELAGAWLLGKDSFAISSVETSNRLSKLFNESNNIERLITDMAKGIRLREDAFEYSQALLEQFFEGYNYVFLNGEENVN